MTLGNSFAAVIEVEVRLQSSGERGGSEEVEAVSPDPFMEKLDWGESKRRWW